MNAALTRSTTRDTMTTCKHTNYSTTTRCFQGCESPRDCNPASHGGSTDIDTCRACGAKRRMNVNGNHIESSRWYAPPKWQIKRIYAEGVVGRDWPVRERLYVSETEAVAEAESQIRYYANWGKMTENEYPHIIEVGLEDDTSSNDWRTYKYTLRRRAGASR